MAIPLLFINFRSDRARQISRAFIESGFHEFERESRAQASLSALLTHYGDDFVVPVAFPPERIKNGLGEYIADLGLRQLRIAETEKYPHVTFFFNGGEETVYPGEDRILVPSPACAHLRSQARDERVRGHRQAGGSDRQQTVRRHRLQLCQPRHGGAYRQFAGAAIKAIETLDTCLGRVVAAQQAMAAKCWSRPITATPN